VPLACLPETDLSTYFGDIEVAKAQVSEKGELIGEKLGVVRGHPIVLQYVLGRAAVERREVLPKVELENFAVPKDISICIAALEQMDAWSNRKPTLSQKLRKIEAEIDEIVLSAFSSLTEDERYYINGRVKQFPLNQVLVRD